MIKTELDDPMWEIKYERIISSNNEEGTLIGDIFTMYADENEDFHSIGYWLDELGGVIEAKIILIYKDKYND